MQFACRVLALQGVWGIMFRIFLYCLSEVNLADPVLLMERHSFQSDISISRYLLVSLLVRIAILVYIIGAFCLLTEKWHRPESNKPMSSSLLIAAKLLFIQHLLIFPFTVKKKKYELRSHDSYASLYLFSKALKYHRLYFSQ